METFLENIRGFLITETELKPNTYLIDIPEWDSLAIVSFLAMVNVEYDKTLDEHEFDSADTIQDLYDLVMKE